MNQLTYAVDNLASVRVNAEASRSRIMDADYAVETSELARTQIIQQAGTAMLAQANQLPQSVLALIQWEDQTKKMAPSGAIFLRLVYRLML